MQQKESGGIMKQKFKIDHNNRFIHTLPEEVQTQIRKDLETYAEENGETLEIDPETDEYLAMSDRFCWIEDIYF